MTQNLSGNFSTTLSTKSLLKRWSSREPDPKLHSVDIWDDVVTNRYTCDGRLVHIGGFVELKFVFFRSVYLDKILLKFDKFSELRNRYKKVIL